MSLPSHQLAPAIPQAPRTLPVVQHTFAAFALGPELPWQCMAGAAGRLALGFRLAGSWPHLGQFPLLVLGNLAVLASKVAAPEAQGDRAGV